MEQEPATEPVQPPMYRFHMRYVSRPADSYYHTRWDLAKPVSVLASNQNEASQKVSSMLGELNHGYRWALTIDRIDEEA